MYIKCIYNILYSWYVRIYHGIMSMTKHLWIPSAHLAWMGRIWIEQFRSPYTIYTCITTQYQGDLRWFWEEHFRIFMQDTAPKSETFDVEAEAQAEALDVITSWRWYSKSWLRISRIAPGAAELVVMIAFCCIKIVSKLYQYVINMSSICHQYVINYHFGSEWNIQLSFGSSKRWGWCLSFALSISLSQALAFSMDPCRASATMFTRMELVG